jgi:hypothetical protein
MTGAEAAARRTAAAAVLGDFHRAASDWIDEGGRQPEWASWAYRLASAVEPLPPPQPDYGGAPPPQGYYGPPPQGYYGPPMNSGGGIGR